MQECDCICSMHLPDGYSPEDLPPFELHIIPCHLHRAAQELLAVAEKVLEELGEPQAWKDVDLDIHRQLIEVVSRAKVGKRMTNCPFCGETLDEFTAFERGRCASCGVEFDDVAQLANRLLAALEELEDRHLIVVPPANTSCTICDAIVTGGETLEHEKNCPFAAIANAKGGK